MQGLKKQYYPPEEIVRQFPAIQHKLGWTEKTIVQLYKNGLLHGYSKASTHMIDFDSLLGLVRHVNHVIERKKISISHVKE